MSKELKTVEDSLSPIPHLAMKLIEYIWKAARLQ